MTATIDKPSVPPGGPRSALTAGAGRSRTAAWPTIAAAAVIAVGSGFWLVGGQGMLPAIILVVAAVLVTAWGVRVAIRRPSIVLAPLAICLVALFNPPALAGIAAHTTQNVGVIALSHNEDGRFALLFWGQYPGIAGWEAPADPAAVDATALAQAVQRAVRASVTTLTDAFGYSWNIDSEVPAGVARIPNGFGGASMFVRVDSGSWVTDSFDGSPAQRTAILAAVQSTADQLGLPTVVDTSGDPTAADGAREWSDGAGRLTLTFDRSRVTLAYAGGPFLISDALPGEYAQRMSGFVGFARPEAIEVPPLP